MSTLFFTPGYTPPVRPSKEEQGSFASVIESVLLENHFGENRIQEMKISYYSIANSSDAPHETEKVGKIISFVYAQSDSVISQAKVIQNIVSRLTVEGSGLSFKATTIYKPSFELIFSNGAQRLITYEGCLSYTGKK